MVNQNETNRILHCRDCNTKREFRYYITHSFAGNKTYVYHCKSCNQEEQIRDYTELKTPFKDLEKKVYGR